MGSVQKKPVVVLVGKPVLHMDGIESYLRATGNEDFLQSMADAAAEGLSDAEILISMMAKLCYKSLTLGKNANVSRVRDIKSNIESAIRSEHGSVLEHANFNFIVRDTSRIQTHEKVRHRAGTAFSQNSGRYIRMDEIDIVCDPILEPVLHHVQEVIDFLESKYQIMAQELGLNDPGLNFDRKKKLTSALRRIAPNGQTNEIGFSMNLRAARFIIKKRTHRSAEWEIRHVFNQVYQLLKPLVPTLFCDEVVSEHEGLLEVNFESHT